MSSLPPRPEQNLEAGHRQPITIRHDRQHGTLVYGTTRGDGAGKILYRYNFRPSDWLPDDDELGAAYWYVPHSRRRSVDRWKLEKVTAALEKAGFTVEVRVDNTTPATGFDDLEAERYERADTRAARYRRKAGAADTRSDAIRADNQRTYDALAGTPILIGHYSETRHRNLLDRLWKREGKAWQLYDQAKQWRSKAQAAERFQHRRQDVGTTQRRIAKLEARLRQIGRIMDGSTEVIWDNPTGWPVSRAGTRHALMKELAARHPISSSWPQPTAGPPSGSGLQARDNQAVFLRLAQPTILLNRGGWRVAGSTPTTRSPAAGDQRRPEP